MVQVKITGGAESLNLIKGELSDIVHTGMQEAFGIPEGKRFQRFFPLAPEDFYYPATCSTRYTIIEIVMFEGRSVPAKKKLTRLLFDRINQQLGIAVGDIEIAMFELPKHNWGIRGVPGDELVLDYAVGI